MVSRFPLHPTMFFCSTSKEFCYYYQVYYLEISKIVFLLFHARYLHKFWMVLWNIEFHKIFHFAIGGIGYKAGIRSKITVILLFSPPEPLGEFVLRRKASKVGRKKSIHQISLTLFTICIIGVWKVNLELQSWNFIKCAPGVLKACTIFQ